MSHYSTSVFEQWRDLVIARIPRSSNSFLGIDRAETKSLFSRYGCQPTRAYLDLCEICGNVGMREISQFPIELIKGYYFTPPQISSEYFYGDCSNVMEYELHTEAGLLGYDSFIRLCGDGAGSYYFISCRGSEVEDSPILFCPKGEDARVRYDGLKAMFNTINQAMSHGLIRHVASLDGYDIEWDYDEYKNLARRINANSSW